MNDTTSTKATSETRNVAASDFSLDTQQQTLSTAWTSYVAKLKGGDLGLIPAVLSIAVLVAIFGAFRGETFLSLLNFGNLLQQASAIIVISMGVTFALLLGEIDLAAGWTAGVTAAVMVTAFQDGRGFWIAVALSLFVALILGAITGYLVSYIGIPSFVVTLAFFLTFQGILLNITGEGGTVQLTNPTMRAIMTKNMGVAGSWIFAGLVIALLGFLLFRRTVDGLPLPVAVLQFVGLTIGVVLFTVTLARDRSFENATIRQIGIPIVVPVVLVLLVILTFVLTRTTYGRHLFAVGGNTEAARRAGINVKFIRMSAFMLCALVSGFGGYLLAARLGSVDPQTGGNQTLLLAVGAAVIGGTSLFGGKGRMINALLGGLVLAIIDNGLPLVGKATPFGIKTIDFSRSGIKFIVSGLILLLAASVDALSRKRANAN
jgi:D-xylose transport system permease protein